MVILLFVSSVHESIITWSIVNLIYLLTSQSERTRDISLLFCAHRRLSSARSEFDSATLSPVGLQHPNCACDDVFSDSADCHAVLCPVHQRYGRLTERQSEVMQKKKKALQNVTVEMNIA